MSLPNKNKFKKTKLNKRVILKGRDVVIHYKDHSVVNLSDQKCQLLNQRYQYVNRPIHKQLVFSSVKSISQEFGIFGENQFDAKNGFFTR